jgi:phosphate starvation-inducible protein PhoH and related proteins
MKRLKGQVQIQAPAPDSIKFELKSAFQRDVNRTIKRNAITVLVGVAGTAKTLLATYTGLQLYHTGEIKKIAVVRLAREAHYEIIGALPGNLCDKLSFISAPIYDNLELMIPKVKIDKMIENEHIEIMPVSYLRGRSLHQTYLIVEEAQNLPREAILTILTRIASGSKIVITCDPDQQDFERHNSIQWLQQLLENVNDAAVIPMPSSENYRHPIITQILANATAHQEALCIPPILR